MTIEHRDFRFSRGVNRRRFVLAGIAGVGTLVSRDLLSGTETETVPTNNPTRHLKVRWTDSLQWERGVNIRAMKGDTWHERLERAQSILSQEGGGVVYFPAGVYHFKDSLCLNDGIIIRGEAPKMVSDAQDERYAPMTRFEFPKYEARLTGDGTPIETAFKGIYLKHPANGANCGLVDLYINRGHIHFSESEAHECRGNRLVYGCVVQNAAVADPEVPSSKIGQRPWQRFPRWHWGAVEVKGKQNILIANNRLPPSTDDFIMPGYVLKARQQTEDPGTERVEYDVLFDYDNRPGLSISDYCIGAAGGREPSGTPETHPWGFRKGIVIRDNYVYCTGRTAIAFSGDGTICENNVVRFKPGVWRPTHTGKHESSGSSTNDNRAVEMRGWRWVVKNNDYEVYRNWAAGHAYHINDGEGLMHENHCNSHIRESELVGNKGNAYLSIYKTGGIDGLYIAENDVRVDRGMAIFVDAPHSPKRPGACHDVTIKGNTTKGGGILIAGKPASNNRVVKNRHLGKNGVIKNLAEAELEGNTNYKVVSTR